MSTDKIKKDAADNGVTGQLVPVQIDKVFLQDGTQIISPLVGCIFSPMGSEYRLFGQQRMTILHGKIMDNVTFPITDFAGREWDLTFSFPNDKGQASGTWKPHHGTGGGTGYDGDGGTYTAQASGVTSVAVAAKA